MIVKFCKKYIEGMAETERDCFKTPWTAGMLMEELSNPDAFFYCFIKNNSVAGYIGMHKILDEGHITNIGVKTSYRKQGVATSLMSYIINESVKAGINALTLEVRVSNIAAINLYTRFGFVSEGVRKKFYGDGEDALIMWKRDMK